MQVLSATALKVVILNTKDQRGDVVLTATKSQFGWSLSSMLVTATGQHTDWLLSKHMNEVLRLAIAQACAVEVLGQDAVLSS